MDGVTVKEEQVEPMIILNVSDDEDSSSSGDGISKGVDDVESNKRKKLAADVILPFGFLDPLPNKNAAVKSVDGNCVEPSASIGNMGGGKEKGENVVESSKPVKQRKPRKVKEIVIEPDVDPMFVDEHEQLHEEPMERDFDGTIVWKKSRPLTSYPDHEQAKMYIRKVKNSKQSLDKVFLTERKVNLTDFTRFRVTECFERLGWLESLRYNNHDKVEIYPHAIYEWMSTLRKTLGDNPPVTTKLIGKVNKKEIELSFESLRGLGDFDANATQEGVYEYPSEAVLGVKKTKEDRWMNMIVELFDVPLGAPIADRPLLRAELKALPRLLFTFMNTNIMPRVSDMLKVRYREVLVLSALMTGRPKLSARHLIMYNVWMAREKQDMIVVPHARLLSELLLKHGGVSKNTKVIACPLTSWNKYELQRGSDWSYKMTKTRHILKLDSGKKLTVRREDIESDVETSEDEEVGMPTVPTFGPPVVTGFAPHQEDSVYVRYLQERMLQARPGVFDSWTDNTQYMFDRQSQMIEEQRMYHHGMMYRAEERQNDDFRYNEWVRRDRDYERGWLPTVRPHQPDWNNMVPYEISNQLPRYAQSTPSPYLRPYQQQQPRQQDQGSSSGGAYDMRELSKSMFDCVFGRQYQPPSYDG